MVADFWVKVILLAQTWRVFFVCFISPQCHQRSHWPACILIPIHQHVHKMHKSFCTHRWTDGEKNNNGDCCSYLATPQVSMTNSTVVHSCLIITDWQQQQQHCCHCRDDFISSAKCWVMTLSVPWTQTAVSYSVCGFRHCLASITGQLHDAELFLKMKLVWWQCS